MRLYRAPTGTLSEHDVRRVVDGADIEVAEGDRVYIEAVMVRVVGEVAEIRMVAKP